MFARTSPARPRGTRPGPFFLFTHLALTALIFILFILVPRAASSLTPNQTGRWTPHRAWSSTAVHMALLPPYDGSHHSQVMWWLGTGHHEYFYGGLWGWKTGEYDCTSYPEAQLDSAQLALPPGGAG